SEPTWSSAVCDHSAGLPPWFWISTSSHRLRPASTWQAVRVTSTVSKDASPPADWRWPEVGALGPDGGGAGTIEITRPATASKANAPTNADRSLAERSSAHRPTATSAVTAASPTYARRPGALKAASTGEVTLTRPAPAAPSAVTTRGPWATSADRHARTRPTTARAQRKAATSASGAAVASERNGSPDQNVTKECRVDTLQKSSAPVRAGKADIASCSRVVTTSPYTTRLETIHGAATRAATPSAAAPVARPPPRLRWTIAIATAGTSAIAVVLVTKAAPRSAPTSSARRGVARPLIAASTVRPPSTATS